MAIASLKDVYLDQLQDLYNACRQSREVTQDLNRSAASSDLQAALRAGVDGIDDGIATLARLIEAQGASPGGTVCQGMDGLVSEARAHAIDEAFTDADVRDAVIITQYQRMVHYAIAGYGCLHAFARRLGLDEDARALKTCLEASRSGDRTMTQLATGGINAAAA